jgi:hypothetical protein
VALDLGVKMTKIWCSHTGDRKLYCPIISGKLEKLKQIFISAPKIFATLKKIDA